MKKKHKCHDSGCRFRHPEQYTKEDHERLNSIFEYYHEKFTNMTFTELTNSFNEKRFDLLANYMENIIVPKGQTTITQAYEGCPTEELVDVMKQCNGLMFCKNCQINIHDLNCKMPRCYCRKCNLFIPSKWK